MIEISSNSTNFGKIVCRISIQFDTLRKGQKWFHVDIGKSVGIVKLNLILQDLNMLVRIYENVG